MLYSLNYRLKIKGSLKWNDAKLEKVFSIIGIGIWADGLLKWAFQMAR